MLQSAPRPSHIHILAVRCNKIQNIINQISHHISCTTGSQKQLTLLQRSQLPGLAPFMGWISWFFPPRENAGWGLKKCEMLMLNIISEVVWVDKYNVRPASQLMAQWDHPGVWQLWQVTVTRLYILTTSPPHYSLKCKSSQNPNMEAEHGPNRWLHLHSRHLLHFNYILTWNILTVISLSPHHC